MSKKKDPICLELVVVGHEKKEESDKNAVFKVRLQTKVTSLKGEEETVARMVITSTEEEIFDDMPLKSERKIQLLDEQTTLE
jgi:hypothetical protein